MKERKFYFVQDKLYRVHVEYEQKVKDALVDKLKLVYGKFDKEEITNKGEYRERRYHDNLMIMMIFAPGPLGPGTDYLSTNTVVYANPDGLDIVREIENKKKKSESDKIKENIKL